MAGSKVKHRLGAGNGMIVEYPDGTAAYIKTLEFTQSFRVHISDITGFSVTRNGKVLERRLHVLGNGTTLASVDVDFRVPEVIERWFRNHPLFHGNVERAEPTPTGPPSASTQSSVADELRKLAGLRDEGILTEREFQEQKRNLLGG